MKIEIYIMIEEAFLGIFDKMLFRFLNVIVL